MTNEHISIDEYRILPAGTKVWSISNQTNIILAEDEIVQIKHKCIGSAVVFAQPVQCLYNLPGFIPSLIGKGTDEWEFSYLKTREYVVPTYESNIVGIRPASDVGKNIEVNDVCTMMDSAIELNGILHAIYGLLKNYEGTPGNVNYVKYCRKKSQEGIQNSASLHATQSLMFHVDMSKRIAPDPVRLFDHVKHQFKMLDDIDSAGDMFKPEWCNITSAVEFLHRLRWSYCKVEECSSDENGVMKLNGCTRIETKKVVLNF